MSSARFCQRHCQRHCHRHAPRLKALAATLLAIGSLGGLGGFGGFNGCAAHAAGVDVLVRDAAGKPLAGAVVYVSSPAAQAALAASPEPRQAEIAQQGRQFVPQVTVLPVGTAVSFPNRDTVRHHIYSFSQVKRFEIKLYAGTPAQPVVFDQPGIAALGCNIHDGMSAWVVSVDTPWYGLTNAEGRLSLPAVPAGSHQLRAWHPSLPPGDLPSEQTLTVASNARAQASLQLTGARH